MTNYDDRTTSPPRVALVLCAALFFAIIVCAVVVLALGDKLDERTLPVVLQLVGIVAIGIPALIGAGYAARGSNDLRNGMVVEKTRQGARRAIEESRPIIKEATQEAIADEQVLTRTGPVVTAEVQALQQLLSTTQQVAENTARIAGRRSGDSPTV